MVHFGVYAYPFRALKLPFLCAFGMDAKAGLQRFKLAAGYRTLPDKLTVSYISGLDFSPVNFLSRQHLNL